MTKVSNINEDPETLHGFFNMMGKELRKNRIDTAMMVYRTKDGDWKHFSGSVERAEFQSFLIDTLIALSLPDNE